MDKPAWDTFNSFPRRHREKTTSIKEMGIRDRVVIEAVCGFIEEQFKSLVLLGGCGTGKTQLAVNACKIIMQRQPIESCRYTSLFNMFSYLKDRLGRDATTWEERQPLIKYTGPQLLVIDDINPSYGSQFEMVTMHQIVDRRYCDQKRHILISNCDEPAFKRLIGEAAFSRLLEDGPVVSLSGPSFRGDRGPTPG